MLDTKLNQWFCSVSEFAKETKLTPQAIRKAIKQGRLMASKIGKQWVIPRQLIQQIKERK